MKLSEEAKNKISNALKGNTHCVGRVLSTETKNKIGEHNRIPKSDFGRRFYEHYHITRSNNPELYDKEKQWFYRHNKCRWE